MMAIQTLFRTYVPCEIKMNVQLGCVEIESVNFGEFFVRMTERVFQSSVALCQFFFSRWSVR